MMVDTDGLDLVRAHVWVLVDRRFAMCGLTHFSHMYLSPLPEGMGVHKLNGNALDNRRANLKLVPNAAVAK
jgi:hypothetical protein